MFKSLLLAGAFLVTSNFVTPNSITVPTVVAALRQPAPHVLVAQPETPNAAELPDSDTAPADGLLPAEREFVTRINDERTSRGLNALTLDPLLVAVARSHSREMCDRDYFDHHSPTPGIVTPMDRYLNGLRLIRQEMPDYLLVGENIYYCSITNDTYNAAYGHRALMNSPGHRANILEPRFAKIGVGTYTDAQGRFWVTEMFLRDVE